MTWNDGPAFPTIVTETKEGRSVVLGLKVPADLFQFRGHFPGMPVLPGVAQLDWAAQFSQSHLGVKNGIREVAQLKFRALITPENLLELRLEFQPQKNRVSFEYKDKNTVYSSGFLKLEEI